MQYDGVFSFAIVADTNSNALFCQLVIKMDQYI